MVRTVQMEDNLNDSVDVVSGVMPVDSRIEEVLESKRLGLQLRDFCIP